MADMFNLRAASALLIPNDFLSVARVMKVFHKLIDEAILPEKVELKDMKIIAQNLPRRIYEDCVKEELAILQKAGEYGGKLCNKVTMEIVKNKLGINSK